MKLIADLHVHTVASGHAFSTVDEAAKAAKEKGIELIAITDHGPALPGGAHPYHFWNLRVLPSEIAGVRILTGIEANIIDPSGRLDMEDEILERLDIVLATFHINCGYEDLGVVKNTEALICSIENQNVDVVAHPGNPAFKVDAKEVTRAAKDFNVAVELNNSSLLHTTSRFGSYENCVDFAREALNVGCRVIISSDSHIASNIGNFNDAILMAEKVGFTEEDVLNSSIDKVLDFLNLK
ncbi:MAG: phosphatase [Actinomycetota bacterium]|nr:phosphatase [Actinomycetota bacterium]